MRKLLSIALLCGLGAVSTASFADESQGFLVGVEAISSDSKGSTLSNRLDDFGLGAFVGYRVNKNIDLLVGSRSLTSMNFLQSLFSDDDDLEASTFYAKLRGKVFVNDNFYGFGEVGMNRWKVKSSPFDDDGFDFGFGAGIGYSFGNADLTLGYDRFEADIFTFSNVAVGFSYKF